MQDIRLTHDDAATLADAPSRARIAADLVPADLDGLLEQYVDEHNRFETFSPTTAAIAWVQRRLGLEPFAGFRAAAVMTALLAIAPLLGAVAVTAATGGWADARLLRWTLVALASGVMTTAVLTRMKSANRQMLQLHRAMTSEEEIRRLLAFDARWFTHRAVGAIALAVLVAGGGGFWLLSVRLGAALPAAGDVVVLLSLWATACELIATLVLLLAEYPVLAAARYDLHAADPGRTAALQVATRGYARFLSMEAVFFTLMSLLILSVLPVGSPVVLPMVGVLLAISYVAVLSVAAMSRLLVRRIVLAHKDRSRRALQRRIAEAWPCDDEGAPLTAPCEEVEGLLRLHERMDATTDSAVGIGTALRGLASSLLLPTVVALLSGALRGVFSL